MEGIINYEAFVLAGIILNLTPGADTLYILGRSISQGKKAGILSVLGISTGASLHCLFAIFGLSSILAQSAIAFQIVKYIGALYLIYLGIKTLLSKSTDNFEIKDNLSNNRPWKIYISGIFTNLLNPKVALFFLAFLPQFVKPTYQNDLLPFAILGATFMTTGIIWCLALAIFSSELSKSIRTHIKFKKWLEKATGTIFIGLGIKLGFTENL